jgi:hypothetical protein
MVSIGTAIQPVVPASALASTSQDPYAEEFLLVPEWRPFFTTDAGEYGSRLEPVIGWRFAPTRSPGRLVGRLCQLALQVIT